MEQQKNLKNIYHIGHNFLFDPEFQKKHKKLRTIENTEFFYLIRKSGYRNFYT